MLSNKSLLKFVLVKCLLRTSDRPEESNDGPPPSWNLGMTRMPIMHVSNQSKHVSNAGVQEWVDLPSEVYECFLSLQGFLIRVPFLLMPH